MQSQYLKSKVICRVDVELSDARDCLDMAENCRKKTGYSFWNSDMNEQLLHLSTKSVAEYVASNLNVSEHLSITNKVRVLIHCLPCHVRSSCASLEISMKTLRSFISFHVYEIIYIVNACYLLTFVSRSFI